MTLQLMGKRRLLVPIPFAVAEVQARLFELLPNPPLTTGQVDLLKTALALPSPVITAPARSVAFKAASTKCA